MSSLEILRGLIVVIYKEVYLLVRVVGEYYGMCFLFRFYNSLLGSYELLVILLYMKEKKDL